MRKKRVRLQTYYNCNQQIVEKKIRFFKFIESENRCTNFSKINITKKKIFCYYRFR